VRQYFPVFLAFSGALVVAILNIEWVNAYSRRYKLRGIFRLLSFIFGFILIVLISPIVNYAVEHAFPGFSDFGYGFIRIVYDNDAFSPHEIQKKREKRYDSELSRLKNEIDNYKNVLEGYIKNSDSNRDITLKTAEALDVLRRKLEKVRPQTEANSGEAGRNAAPDGPVPGEGSSLNGVRGSDGERVERSQIVGAIIDGSNEADNVLTSSDVKLLIDGKNTIERQLKILKKKGLTQEGFVSSEIKANVVRYCFDYENYEAIESTEQIVNKMDEKGLDVKGDVGSLVLSARDALVAFKDLCKTVGIKL